MKMKLKKRHLLFYFYFKTEFELLSVFKASSVDRSIFLWEIKEKEKSEKNVNKEKINWIERIDEKKVRKNVTEEERN